MGTGGTDQAHSASGPLKVLLVDDDEELSKTYATSLSRSGALVTTASSGKQGLARLKDQAFDVIVSDISMPEMTGIDFLKAVRMQDLDVPVVLMTGSPGIDSATQAVEYGASSYLTKPVGPHRLWDTLLRASRIHALARLKRQASDISSRPSRPLGEKAALDVRYSWGISRMWMAFQPVVDVRAQRVFGYEALLRSDEPMMQNPADILDAAERLGRLHELGRTIRGAVAEAAKTAPTDCHLLVNLHSSDLNDEDLYSPSAPLSSVASRVILEVTERASLYDVKDVRGCVVKLRALGYRIAIDDLGAGYAGLTSFTQLYPDIAKLDMSLIRGIDQDPRLQTIVRSMNKLCDELSILVITEGVETPAERDELLRLGCGLHQGYLYAKPQRGFPEPRW